MTFFSELKRRNVFRVAALYLVSSWLMLQVADVLAGLLSLPDWSLRFVGFILLLGFPIALAFSWAYELTPDGLKRDADVDHSAAKGRSVVAQTGRRLDYVTIALVLAGAAFLVFDRMRSNGFPRTGDSDPQSVQATDPSGHPSVRQAGPDDFIAVLPFANLSSDPENEFFADGVGEEILNRLAQVPSLNVIARSSSFSFKDTSADAREIGQALGARHILEGSVRRQADQVRISAQLIATQDGGQLWSDSYDHQLDDVFAVQDAIAESVAHALNVVLDDAARATMNNVGVRDVDAFVAYQRGRTLANEAHDADLVTPELVYPAYLEFSKAIERAPGFSQAYLAKSDYYAHLLISAENEPAVQANALANMRQALDQAYELARDPSRKSWIAVERALFSEDWTGLRAIAEQALTAPGCVNANWLKLLHSFRFERSIRGYLEQQIKCDPGSVFGYAYLAELATLRGQFEEAASLIERGEATAGRATWLQDARRLLLMRQGQWESVLTEFAGDTVSWRGVVFSVSAMVASGRLDEARAIVETTNLTAPFALIITHAVTGNREMANQTAAELDSRAGGFLQLIRSINLCRCGAPFDLYATPNFAARISEAGIEWPPVTVIDYSASD